jgi:hypothetical protein
LGRVGGRGRGGGDAVACMYYTVYVNVLWGKGEGQIELVM